MSLMIHSNHVFPPLHRYYDSCLLLNDKQDNEEVNSYYKVITHWLHNWLLQSYFFNSFNSSVNVLISFLYAILYAVVLDIIRKHFFSQRIVNDWNSLPEEVMEGCTVYDL